MKLYQYDLTLDKERRNNYLTYAGEVECSDEWKIVNSPERIQLLLEEAYQLSTKAEEYVYLLAVNSKCRIIGVFLISKGTGSTAQLGIREIYIRALLIGAALILVVHNHPSGDPNPSKEDIFITKKLKKAGGLLGIPIVDHIIIGSSGYYSFRTEGLL